MTLLHQAAQKAVEAMPRYYMNAENGHMTESKRGAWVRWIDVVSALQHQEVPREPVARPSMSMYASAADYSAAMDGWIAATRQCPACRGKFGVDCQACDLCNATGRVPSATQQQEVGSGLLDNETFRKGIREDGTVEGYCVETYYLPCKAIGDDTGFLRVVMDDNATDAETRVPHSALIAQGWVRASAPSTPEKGEKDDAGGVKAVPVADLRGMAREGAMQAALDALRTAHTGLMWYRGMMPEYVDGSDGEADAEITAAIAVLEGALGVQGTFSEQEKRDA